MVGGKFDVSGQDEQELGNWLGRKNGREFGEVVREVTGKIGRCKCCSVQYVDGYVYSVGNKR